MLNTENPAKIQIQDLSFYYGEYRALQDIQLNFYENQVSALIGPNGSGKSTLLRCVNLMHIIYPQQKMLGKILLDKVDILEHDLQTLRNRVGMVFQKPTPFPMSIYNNVAFGVKLYERLSRQDMDQRVEWALTEAGLWDEVKDKLKKSGLGLSGGQQQRLCIARAIAVKPQILLLDEPTSALDPKATDKIETLIHKLKKDFTLVIVTHNMQQAARVSDYTAFLLMGRLIEFNKTDIIFHNAAQQQTRDYVSGKFG